LPSCSRGPQGPPISLKRTYKDGEVDTFNVETYSQKTGTIESNGTDVAPRANSKTVKATLTETFSNVDSSGTARMTTQVTEAQGVTTSPNIMNAPFDISLPFVATIDSHNSVSFQAPDDLHSQQLMVALKEVVPWAPALPTKPVRVGESWSLPNSEEVTLTLDGESQWNGRLAWHVVIAGHSKAFDDPNSMAGANGPVEDTGAGEMLLDKHDCSLLSLTITLKSASQRGVTSDTKYQETWTRIP
jgi:hypothetical protein